ncbi:MAG: hypothetical protein EBU93_04850 [Chlamydiae bacterium]|nr:hypothetical protein [Chlamydiota bacterium]
MIMAFQFGVKKEDPKKEEEKDSPPASSENKEDWMTKKWRPMMAIMYMICCLADFAIFPIMFTIVQFWETQAANDAFRQWVPITLQGGGLFHVAMGAVLGVTAFGRTQEKIAGAANGTPTPTLSPNSPSPMPQMSGGYTPPVRSMPSSYNDPYANGSVTTSSTTTTTTTTGAPNLARIRQLDPDNVFERG